MRILIITPAYKPAYIYGGPIMSVAELCEKLVLSTQCPVHSTPTEVTVYTTTANGKEELNVDTSAFQNINGVQVKYFKRLTKDNSHFSPGLLRAVWKNRNNYDIVHIHWWWNLVLLFSLVVLYFTKTKIVLSPRGMVSKYTLRSGAKRQFMKILGKRLLRRTTLHATSEMEYQECLHLVPGWKGFIAYNFVKLCNENRKPEAGNRKNLSVHKLIFLGRIDKKKGLELLFHAIVLLREKFKIWLDIIGDGEDGYVNSLKELTLKLSIAENIHWLGRIDSADKFDYLKASDFLMLPSYNENFANVVVELLLVGTPVVISENVGLCRYVEKNNLGWVHKLSVTGLEETIAKALQDTGKQVYIRSNAPAIVSADFTGNNLAEVYIKQYEGLLG